MSSLENYEAYRFVLVYRREPREIPGAETWRGWVAPVPGTGTQLQFSELDELPDIIRQWVLKRQAATDDDFDGGLGE